MGMWANVEGEEYLAIIVRAWPESDKVQLLAPEIDHYYHSHISSVTPRPDLPRAFTSLGYPTDDTPDSP